MNQTCKVCGEPAAGFHFGAFTCEGCKSFFGRSFNNVSAISECKNNGECVINKKNRTTCKACRLRKCLLVGMSKSGSRYGRRSNWFKIHCLLQEQQEKQQQHHDGRTMSPTMQSPYAFGMPPNGFLHKVQEEDYKTVSTPSTSPASSHISDSPTSNMDLLSKIRASGLNAPSPLFDPKTMMGHSVNSANKMPKDFFMPMAFPGMPFPMPPTNLAQLFFSGFGAAAANTHPGAMPHHYQDMLKSQGHFFGGNPELMAKPSFLSMDQMMMHKHFEEERHRAALNSPPVSVSPSSPPSPQEFPRAVSFEAKSLISSPSVGAVGRTSADRIQVTASRGEDTDDEAPATKRHKHSSSTVCGNTEESSNINAAAAAAVLSKTISSGEQPLDLSLTKGDDGGNNNTEYEAAAASAHLQSMTMSTVSRSGGGQRQKYKEADCRTAKQIAQTGGATTVEGVNVEDDVDGEDDDVQVDDDEDVEVDDQKQTAFFDYFKQTFVRENQFLKIKNNEIYSF